MAVDGHIVQIKVVVFDMKLQSAYVQLRFTPRLELGVKQLSVQNEKSAPLKLMYKICYMSFL